MMQFTIKVSDRVLKDHLGLHCKLTQKGVRHAMKDRVFHKALQNELEDVVRQYMEDSGWDLVWEIVYELEYPETMFDFTKKGAMRGQAVRT